MRATSGDNPSYGSTVGTFEFSSPKEDSAWISFAGDLNYHWVQDLAVNASNSSSIYKNSATVKPKNINVLPLIRL